MLEKTAESISHTMLSSERAWSMKTAGRGRYVDVSNTAGTAGLKTITTQAEFDALKPGAEFIQNGQKKTT